MSTSKSKSKTKSDVSKSSTFEASSNSGQLLFVPEDEFKDHPLNEEAVISLFSANSDLVPKASDGYYQNRALMKAFELNYTTFMLKVKAIRLRAHLTLFNPFAWLQGKLPHEPIPA